MPGVVKSHRYEDAKRDTNWVLPSDDDYHKRSAGIAHTRSLEFLKPLLKGPYFELEDIWNEHCKFEFAERDVESTMATMVDEPYVNHIPTMTYVSPLSWHSLFTHFQTHNLYPPFVYPTYIPLTSHPQRRHRQSPPNLLLHAPLHLLQPARHKPIPHIPDRRHRPRNRRIRLRLHAHNAHPLAAPRHPADRPPPRARVHQRRGSTRRPPVPRAHCVGPGERAAAAGLAAGVGGFSVSG